ncbi:GntR family transcriptional regulator [Streptomyces phaeochromogenes]
MRDDPDYVPRRLRVHPSRKFADTLRKQIADGTWAPGTVRRSGELRRRFGTTPHVIRKTVLLLRDEGLVDTRPGGGGLHHPERHHALEMAAAGTQGRHRRRRPQADQ